MTRLHPTDADRRQDAITDALEAMYAAMDLHPDYHPCRNAPKDFADAFVRLENAWIDWFAHTARTATPAKRTATGAGQ